LGSESVLWPHQLWPPGVRVHGARVGPTL